MANKSTTGQKHPYHLVDPSPLPFLSSIAGLALAAGLVFYMHYGTSWLLILGTIGLLTIMFLWWRDVIKESTFQKVHTCCRTWIKIWNGAFYCFRSYVLCCFFLGFF